MSRTEDANTFFAQFGLQSAYKKYVVKKKTVDKTFESYVSHLPGAVYYGPKFPERDAKEKISPDLLNEPGV